MQNMSTVYRANVEETLRDGLHVLENSTTSKFNCSTPLVRCVVWALILLFISIIACGFVVWLILHPRVPDIRIDSLTLSNFTLSEARLRAGDCKMRFTVINPNWKINLWFSRSDVYLLYKSDELSKSSFEAFSLHKMNRTSKTVKFAVNSHFGAQKQKTAMEMDMDLSKKEVSFNVSMEGLAFITVGKWFSQRKSMKVFCEGLKVEFLANATGKLNSEKHDCSARFF